jgi:hypothetical protein
MSMSRFLPFRSPDGSSEQGEVSSNGRMAELLPIDETWIGGSGFRQFRQGFVSAKIVATSAHKSLILLFFFLFSLFSQYIKEGCVAPQNSAQNGSTGRTDTQ